MQTNIVPVSLSSCRDNKYIKHFKHQKASRSAVHAENSV